MVSGLTATLVALALGLAGHSRSEGSSQFVVDPDVNRVAITIDLLTVDMPELCDVDVSLSDPDQRRHEEQRLRACVERGLPGWLRLHTDEGDCQVVAVDVKRGQGFAITFTGIANCPSLAGATLTLDWGLFASTRLDHISTATIVVGTGVEPQRTLLSRRNNKVRVKIPAPRHPAAIAVVGVVVAGVAIAAVMLVRRRRRQLQQAR